jgi:hypothetical protein
MMPSVPTSGLRIFPQLLEAFPFLVSQLYPVPGCWQANKSSRDREKLYREWSDKRESAPLAWPIIVEKLQQRAAHSSAHT